MKRKEKKNLQKRDILFDNNIMCYVLYSILSHLSLTSHRSAVNSGSVCNEFGILVNDSKQKQTQ